jgi:hypothetical protein
MSEFNDSMPLEPGSFMPSEPEAAETPGFFATEDVANGGGFEPTHEPQEKKPWHKKIRWWGWTLIGLASFIIVLVIGISIVLSILDRDFQPPSPLVMYSRGFSQPVPADWTADDFNFENMNRAALESRIDYLVNAVREGGADTTNSSVANDRIRNTPQAQAYLIELLQLTQELTLATRSRASMINTNSIINILATSNGLGGAIRAGSTLRVEQYSAFSTLAVHGEGWFTQTVSGAENIQSSLANSLNNTIAGFANLRERQLYIDADRTGANADGSIAQRHRFDVFAEARSVDLDFSRVDHWGGASYSHFTNLHGNIGANNRGLNHQIRTTEVTIPAGRPAPFQPLLHAVAERHNLLPGVSLQEEDGSWKNLSSEERTIIHSAIAALDPHLMIVEGKAVVNPNSTGQVNPTAINNFFGIDMTGTWARMGTASGGGTSFPALERIYDDAGQIIDSSYYYLRGEFDGDLFWKRVNMGWTLYHHDDYITRSGRYWRYDYNNGRHIGQGNHYIWDDFIQQYRSFTREWGTNNAGTNFVERGGRMYWNHPEGQYFRSQGVTLSGHVFTSETIDFTKTAIRPRKAAGPEEDVLNAGLADLDKAQPGLGEQMRPEFVIEPFDYWQIDIVFNEDQIDLAGRYSAANMIMSINSLVRPSQFSFTDLSFVVEFFPTGHIRRFYREETYKSHAHLMSPIGARGTTGFTNPPSINKINEIFGYDINALTRGMGIAYFLQPHVWGGTNAVFNSWDFSNTTAFPYFPQAVLASLALGPR